MSTKFFTKLHKNTIFNKFKSLIDNNKDIEFFDALVGYFRASYHYKNNNLLKQIN